MTVTIYLQGVALFSICRKQILISALSHLKSRPKHKELKPGEKKIKAGNFRIGGFPNVIGAIDGTHVRIQAPTTDEASYVNRKGYHIINVQAVCDADGMFTKV
ncbi:putative nuclease HARBI1 [Mytilus californianus]|uniref:putative nuclease HARBI1 n=1 Tax=Mytilus californianus TaxID=6549 RepID=UPI0022462704|nr:putative nuclease HARBI1 [Mytilus californianus]